MSDWSGRTKGAIVEYEGARYSATLYEGLDHAYVYLRPHPQHVKLARLTIISEAAGWAEALRDPDGKPTKALIDNPHKEVPRGGLAKNRPAAHSGQLAKAVAKRRKARKAQKKGGAR